MKVLVVDDNESTRNAVRSDLEKLEFKPSIRVVTAGTLSEAENALGNETFDVAFLDIRLGPHYPEGGVRLLRQIQKFCPYTVVIMMTSVKEDPTIDQCIALGAAWYIIKPFDPESASRIMTIAQKYHRLWRKNRSLQIQAGDRAVSRLELKTKSPLFQKVLDQAKRLKGSKDVSILLLGENGVGKEVLARYLWSLEEDDSRPFVPVHVGALPESLVESELFGHKKGAFTDAKENRIGKFEHANGGDLFLDEMATMSLKVQQIFLRVLQDKKIIPTGSNTEILTDCRVICATNGNLGQMVKDKVFREDLYYRIRQATLMIPPLRFRKEDIPDLVNQFLERQILGKKSLSQSAMQFCLDYDWPGNIRQLENALKTLTLMTDGPEISKEDLLTQISLDNTSPWEMPPVAHSDVTSAPFGLDETKIQRNYKKVLREVEQTMVILAMKKTGGSKQAAASFLGIPRTTLNSKTDSWGWMESNDSSLSS